MSTLGLGGAVLTGTAAGEEKKIKVGQSRVSHLGADDPTDVYVLELAEATDVVITMSVGTKRGDGDGNANGQDVAEDTTASLEVFDSSGTPEGSDFIETGKTEAQIVVSPLSVGTHTIEASTDTVSPNPFSYTLTVTGSL